MDGPGVSKPPKAKTKAPSSTVARHAERAAIEAALARNVPLRTLERRYGVSTFALCRHRQRMRVESPQMFAALAAADWKVKPEELEALRLETSEGWLKQVRAQYAKFVGVQDACLESGDYQTAAVLGQRCEKLLDMLGRAVDELSNASVRVEMNVVSTPGYWAVRTALAQALQPFPEARAAVLASLRRIEGDEEVDAGAPPLLQGHAIEREETENAA